jgi:hypothetical protein
MRLTVGPLPPAVYWRRRAVVLGVVFLFLIVLIYSYAGQENSGANPKQTTSPSAGLDPGGAPLTPGTGAPSPGGGLPVAGDPPGDAVPGDGDAAGEPVVPGDGGTVPAAPPPADGSCTDEEIAVVPEPSQASAKRGVTIEIRLKIRNVSDRTCDRDLGSEVQEIYIRSGAQLIWSSDACSAPGASNVQSLVPNIVHEYRVAWNGRDSSRCTDLVASGPHPQAGDYQVFGRLGTKLGEPVKLTITG